MTSHEFIEQVGLARTATELDDLIKQHQHCLNDAGRDAIEEARLLIGPLASWSESTVSDPPPESLADRVANELSVRPAHKPTWFRRTGRQWISAALVCIVAVGLFFWKSPLVVGTGATSQPSLITESDGADGVDPQAVAYVEKTERWLLSAVSVPTDVDLRFDVSFEEPANWFATNVLPVAESLKRAGTQTTISEDEEPAS